MLMALSALQSYETYNTSSTPLRGHQKITRSKACKFLERIINEYECGERASAHFIVTVMSNEAKPIRAKQRISQNKHSCFWQVFFSSVNAVSLILRLFAFKIMAFLVSR